MSMTDRAKTWAARTVLRAAGVNVADNATWNTIVSNAKGETPRMGTAAIIEGIQRMPWFKAVNDKVSSGVAAVPWMLYVDRSGAGGKPVKRYDLRSSRDPIARLRYYQRTIGPQRAIGKAHMENEEGFSLVPAHPALDLIEHGNTQFPGAVCIRLLQQYLDTVGEAFAPMDMNGLGQPTDLWPVPPTWVSDLRIGVQGDLRFYQVTPKNGGVKDVPESHMFRMWNPNLADPYGRGRGLGHALGDELETDEYAARHMKAWFYNRARPDVLITAEGLQLPDIERLERGWLSKLKGTAGVGRPHFINRKVDVKELQASFKDMALSELRRDERDIIIHVYGVPPEIFGIIENSNRSTIDAADYIYAKHVLTPRLEFMRMMMQVQIVDRFDDRLVLDYVSPVEENLDYELDVMRAQPAAFTVDEWRQQAHKAPFNDAIGKGHIAPMNTQYAATLADLGASPEPPPPAPGADPVVDDDDDDAEDPPAPGGPDWEL
jgi:hypothetical protein